jgi:hypothetical protein
MSFCDYCVDVLHLDARTLMNDVVNSTFEKYDEPTRRDLFIYTTEIDLTNYIDCMEMIVESETCTKSSIQDVLYHRLRSNYGLALGLKHTNVIGLTKEELNKLMISFFTFFVFFDDVEDYLDDINQGTPTYISKLYETCQYSEFVRLSNLCIYYTFTNFLNHVKGYNHSMYMILDFYKSIYLKLESSFTRKEIAS